MSFHPIPLAGCSVEQPHWVHDGSFLLSPFIQPFHPRRGPTLPFSEPQEPSSVGTSYVPSLSDKAHAAVTMPPTLITSTSDPLLRSQDTEWGADKSVPVRIEDYSPPRPTREDPLPVFVSTRNLLHRVCFFGASEERIDMILRVDPGAATRKESVAHRTKVHTWNAKDNQVAPRPRSVKAPYQYPVHLFIASVARRLNSQSGDRMYKVCEVERLTEGLLQAGRQVLKSSDGSNGATSLMILVKEWSSACCKDDHLVDCLLRIMTTMLAIEPSLAHRRDCRGNTPLHVAVQYGAPFALLKAVYRVNPSSLQRINIQGVTPLDIALRRTRITKENEAVVDYLTGCLDERHVERNLP